MHNIYAHLQTTKTVKSIRYKTHTRLHKTVSYLKCGLNVVEIAQARFNTQLYNLADEQINIEKMPLCV